MSQTKFDVIVIGAGPSGSTAARNLAKKGISTLIIDKQEFPRYKPCGGGLSGRIKNILDIDISQVVERESFGIKVYADGIFFDGTLDQSSGFLVMRNKFDNLLLEKAIESGAEFKGSTRLIGLTYEQDHYKIKTSNGTFEGSYIVGADGVNSLVAKLSGLRYSWDKDEVAIAIEAELKVGKEEVERITANPNDPEHVSIEIYFGPVKNGYAWCFPKYDTLSLGVGARLDKAGRIRDSWFAFIDYFSKMKKIKIENLKYTAHMLPFGGFLKKPYKDRLLLVGDAAGFVSPATGEGIYYGILSGIHAATAISEAIESNDPSKIKKYAKYIKDEIIRDMSVGKYLANILYRKEKNPVTIIKLANQDNEIKTLFSALIMGSIPYDEIKKRMTKQILLHYPTKGLRMFL